MNTKVLFEKRSAIVIKTMYFLVYAASAAWSTFFFVYLKNDCHLSGFQVGLLAAVQQINSIIFLPLWGMIADRYGKKKTFLLLLGLSFVLLQGFMLKGNFLFYLLFIIIFSAINNPLALLIDSFAIDESHHTAKQVSYGQMRLWASTGWALSSVLTGILVRPQSMIYIFPIASALFAIAWLMHLVWYKQQNSNITTATPSFKTVKALLTEQPRLLWFLLFVLVFQIFNSPTLMFINMYYNEIGGTMSQIGIAFAVQSVFELPFFFWGHKLILKYGSRQVLFFTMLVAALRLCLYGLTANPWVAIMIGSLHGITLGLFYVAVVDYVHSIVPHNQTSTGQSIMYVFLGIGTSIGNLLNGYCNDTMTLKTGMLLNAAMVLLLVLATMTYLRWRKRNAALTWMN